MLTEPGPNRPISLDQSMTVLFFNNVTVRTTEKLCVILRIWTRQYGILCLFYMFVRLPACLVGTLFKCLQDDFSNGRFQSRFV